jgi:hypothetical protein
VLSRWIGAAHAAELTSGHYSSHPSEKCDASRHILRPDFCTTFKKLGGAIVEIRKFDGRSWANQPPAVCRSQEEFPYQLRNASSFAKAWR